MEGKLRRNSSENPNAKTNVGDPELIEIIRAEIDARGPVSFARFMELALYHPQHGYYASGRARIGRQGDFFTNVSVGPLFGKFVAAQFAEIWERLEQPRAFKIVEQGAHDGQFAADVLGALRDTACFAALHYVIVEPFAVWRERQQKNLASFSTNVSWFESIAQLQPFTGIHFSNELFDALPVHLLTSDARHWQELFVAIAGDRFEFEERSCSGGVRPPRATAAYRRYSTETHRAGPKLMKEIAAKLSRGVILTIDYGFPRDEFYSIHRSEGSLQIRAKQKKLSSPFEQIGLADISAHVEWSSLAEAARSSGAAPIGFTDQHHFFTGILSAFFRGDEFNSSEKRALQTLLHPEMLGRNFQVLALGKDFSGALSGFQFARNAAAELGL